MSHVKMSVRRAARQALTLSKCKNGRLWKENRCLLSRETAQKLAENVCLLNLQWACYTCASGTRSITTLGGHCRMPYSCRMSQKLEHFTINQPFFRASYSHVPQSVTSDEAEVLRFWFTYLVKPRLLACALNGIGDPVWCLWREWLASLTLTAVLSGMFMNLGVGLNFLHI